MSPDNVVEMSKEELMEVVGGANTIPSGMPCPVCRGFIPITIWQIVTESSIICPHCGLQLNINHQESQPAIEVLSRFEQAEDYLLLSEDDLEL